MKLEECYRHDLSTKWGKDWPSLRNQQDPGNFQGFPPCPARQHSPFSGCGTFLEDAQIALCLHGPRSTDVLELLCRSANSEQTCLHHPTTSNGFPAMNSSIGAI